MNYTVCSCDARDRQAILDLWQRNLPEALPDRYAWLYEMGPATGLLLCRGEDRAVGGAGMMRRDFWALGAPTKAAQAIDLNVDRDHRTVGPALKLQRAVVASVDARHVDLAYGFPNRPSEAVLRLAGYRALGELQRWVKPLSSRAAFDHWRWPPWLARGLALVCDPFLPGKWPELLRRLPPGTCFEPADRFDARFDAFWQSARHHWPILGERTSAYLNWRFSQCPDQRYRAMCLTGRGGSLLGYVVYGRRGPAVYVADLLVADGEHLDPLLAGFLRLVRRENAERVVVLYFGNPAVSKALRRFGFWQRPSGRKAMVYLGKGDSSPFLQPENWHLTSADIDTDE